MSALEDASRVQQWRQIARAGRAEWFEAEWLLMFGKVLDTPQTRTARVLWFACEHGISESTVYRMARDWRAETGAEAWPVLDGVRSRGSHGG